MSLSRADQSLFSDWWFSIDRTLIALTAVLLVAGIVASLAATPPIAARLGLDPFHFVVRHALFAAIGFALFLAVSTLSPRQIRRLALWLLLAGLALMAAAFAQGIERNGAIRWLSIAGFSLQPSEIAKPGFVVLSAWLLSEGRRRADVPALPISLALLALFAVMLVLQPDVGQAFLMMAVWASLFFLAGYPVRWVALLSAAVWACAILAYFTLDHVRQRIHAFLNPPPAGHTQADMALAAFREGGWFGRGPGEGVAKVSLPDSHTDYVFAVVAEEFGIISCLFLVLIYALLAWRGMTVRSGEASDDTNLAKAGLTLMIVMQALTNMAVTVNLVPAKGVTLPLISHGGSSLLATAVALGMILSLSRKRASTRMPRWTTFEEGRIGAPSKEMKI